MSDKRNIDRFFQEKFKDFEVQPPSNVWDAIDKELDQKTDRKVIPLWWKFAGIAAVLAILFSSIYLGLENNDSINSQPYVNIDRDVNDDNISSKSSSNDTVKQLLPDGKHKKLNKNQLVTEDSRIGKDFWGNVNKESNINTSTNNPTKESNLITSSEGPSDTNSSSESNKGQTNHNSPHDKPKYQIGIAQNENKINKPTNQTDIKEQVSSPENSSNTGVAASDGNNSKTKLIEGKNSSLDKDRELIDNAVVAVDSTNKSLSTLEQIAAQEKKEDSIKNNVFKGKWAASTQVGPVYSNSLSGSAVNNEVANNDRNAGFNLSYGIGLSYELSPRLSVRTGINQVNMSYSTQDINYQLNFGIASRGNLVAGQTYSASAVRNALPSNSIVANDALQAASVTQEFTSGQFQGIKGELSQQVGYLEVPLELKYSLLNRKLKINVLGGMSALFLTDNVVAVHNSGERLELGEDSNFNSFNQSANFGLGLGYDFTNQLGAFIEPTFKYQLNALRNNVADFRPYTIGIQSGVTYKF